MKISVVVPMFNASRTVLKCIQALAVQETAPHEVIIVDNDSTDNSRGVVEDARGKFRDLNIILCEESKKGPAAARNKGASIAAGDIIAFTDSDCIPDRSWVKSIEEAFRQDKGLDGIGGINKISIPVETVMGKFLSAFWHGSEFLSQSPILRKEDIFDDKVIITFNCAFNKGFFRKINGFDEAFKTGEDIDVTLRAVDAGGKMIAWNKDMAVYHVQDISFKSLLKRQFHYAKGLVLNIDRHFRNNIFVCTDHKCYHWPNKMGLTVVLMTNVPKTFILMAVLLAVSSISLKLLGVVVLSTLIYFLIRTRKFIRNSGLHLTVRGIFIAFFFYLGKQFSDLYGRMYWSFKYKVICL